MSNLTITEKLLMDSLFKAARFYQSELQSISLKKIIRLLRKRLKMSQKTLAKKAKIPASTLSRIESGQTKPRLETIEKIFEALFCDIVFLPIPRADLDQIVKQQIHLIAEKRVRYLKGTMALELQQPKEEVLQQFILREEKALEDTDIDIWQKGENP